MKRFSLNFEKTVHSIWTCFFLISVLWRNWNFVQKHSFVSELEGCSLKSDLVEWTTKMLKPKASCYPQSTERETILIEFRENRPLDLDMLLFDISVVANLKFRPEALSCLRRRGLFFGKRFGRMNNNDAEIESIVLSPEHQKWNDFNWISRKRSIRFGHASFCYQCCGETEISPKSTILSQN